MIQEYSDLDELEREFILVWNAAIESRIHISDRDTALVCRQVLQQSNGSFPEKIWTVHLLSLWENRQLGREDMLILMKEYHQQRSARAAVVGMTDEEEDGE